MPPFMTLWRFHLTTAAADADDRAIVRSELARAQEFASLARNAGRPDGPLPVIRKLTNMTHQ